jgi:hypothetical protein
VAFQTTRRCSKQRNRVPNSATAFQTAQPRSKQRNRVPNSATAFQTAQPRSKQRDRVPNSATAFQTARPHSKQRDRVPNSATAFQTAQPQSKKHPLSISLIFTQKSRFDTTSKRLFCVTYGLVPIFLRKEARFCKLQGNYTPITLVVCLDALFYNTFISPSNITIKTLFTKQYL